MFSISYYQFIYRIEKTGKKSEKLKQTCQIDVHDWFLYDKMTYVRLKYINAALAVINKTIGITTISNS